jgi:hypothetical protein
MSSITFTLGNIFARQRYDTTLQFAANQQQAAELALSVDGVEGVEVR